ncbi:MAG TPA: serine/threonine protein kinase [Anaerolineae bacterium]|nr:serine/threonine protein kinase [Anaerolineae bacterium]
MTTLETNHFAYHVGRSVGRYKLERILGRGAMAEVYKSRHPDLDRDIAVKILHPFHTQVPGFIERFRYEAQAAASLHHPNIVQVYDFSVTDDGLYYMVMQYINGLSFEEYLELENAPLSIATAYQFFRQVANALQFAHQQGTIHRDMKPANIMLDTRENAYLGDFGLAKIVGVSMQTQSGFGPGTPDYMAPEQIEGKNLTAAIDIYAMGVILYRMLTNHLPYNSDSWITTIKRKATEPPVPPQEYNPELSWSLEDVILTALAREPGDRFASMAEMLAALETAVKEALGELPKVETSTSRGVVALPGVQIENYKIKREFKRDSTRIYQRYLAYNVALKNLAVLTLLRLPATGESNFLTRFQNRINALTSIDHPGVAAITRFDVTEDNQPYVAYEYTSGQPLNLEIQRRIKEEDPFLATESLRLLQQTVEALAVVHETGVIHNELRPENIVLSHEGLPVIVGLEIPVAADYSAISRPANVVDYASPEQLAGEPLTITSNIYSLGIILYEMLAGTPPVIPMNNWHPSNNGSSNLLVNGLPLVDARTDLMPETYALVQAATEQDPCLRIPDLDAFLLALDEAIAAESRPKRKPFMAVYGRGVYTAVSLLIILLFVAGLFSAQQFIARGQAPPVPSQPVIAPVDLPPTDTPTPEPPLLDTPVEMLSLPPNDQFVYGDTVTLAWFWDRSLFPSEQFVVSLQNKDGEIELGTVAEPSGDGRYQLTVDIVNFTDQTGPYNLKVRLQNKETDRLVAENNDLPVLLALPSPTPTQTPTSTHTVTATPTASNTPDLTATRLVSCIPPEDWEEYTIVRGDALFDIALATGSTVEELMLINCLESTVLSIGYRLWVPRLPATATTTPTPVFTETATPQPPAPKPSNTPVPITPSRTPPPTPLPSTPDDSNNTNDGGG